MPLSGQSMVSLEESCKLLLYKKNKKNKPFLKTGNEGNGYTKTKTMVSESDKKP